MTDILTQTVDFPGYGGNRLVGKMYAPAGAAMPHGLVLVHGLRSDSREFGDVGPALAARDLGVLCFDLSGHGESEGTPLLVNAESHLADTKAAVGFMAAQGAHTICILGHSFGAHPALKILLGDDRVDRAVLVSPQVRSGAGLSMPKRLAFKIVAGLAAAFPEAASRRTLNMQKDYDANFTTNAAVRWAEKIDWDPGRVNLGTLAYARGMDNEMLAARVNKPVLMIVGERDQKVPPSSSGRLARAFPAGTLETLSLADTGHSPFAPPLDGRLIDAIKGFMISKAGAGAGG